jgi:hypothetical protein
MESAPQAAANISITVREFRMPHYIQELRRNLNLLSPHRPLQDPETKLCKVTFMK